MKSRAFLLVVAAAVVACSSDASPDAPPPDTSKCAGNLEAFRFPSGGDGHADPFGAKSAGQARAGKIHDASQIVQPASAKHKVHVGDYVLANDRIALYLEAEDRPNGYSTFGG